MLYVPIPSQPGERPVFETMTQLVDWACKLYGTDRTRTQLRLRMITSFESPDYGNITTYQVEIVTTDFHEYFDLIESEKKLDLEG